MLSNDATALVKFAVRPHISNGGFSVFESGFSHPLAQFDDMETAEQYALRIAESKANWKVDVYDASGQLAGTYNSEDDAMPKA